MSFNTLTWLGRDVEVALVQRYQRNNFEALRQSNDAGVGRAKRQVGILLDQIGGTDEIVSGGAHNVEEPGLE